MKNKPQTKSGMSMPMGMMDMPMSMSMPMDMPFNNVENMFNNMMNNSRAMRMGNMMFPMRMDFSETANEYTMSADLPGINKNDVEVSMEDGMLTVQGERSMEEESENMNMHRMERSYGSFCRRMSMPSDADENNVQADMKNGVLTITIAKSKQPMPKSRRVTIK